MILHGPVQLVALISRVLSILLWAMQWKVSKAISRCAGQNPSFLLLFHWEMVLRREAATSVLHQGTPRWKLVYWSLISENHTSSLPSFTDVLTTWIILLKTGAVLSLTRHIPTTSVVKTSRIFDVRRPYEDFVVTCINTRTGLYAPHRKFYAWCIGGPPVSIPMDLHLGLGHELLPCHI